MILFINAAYREGSRSLRLAEHYLERYQVPVSRVNIGDMDLPGLSGKSLAVYNNAVATKCFDDPMFDIPKQLKEADEIIIVSPFWNYTLPAALHAYLEYACAQGVTFDMAEDGTYFSLCKAKKLVYITTAGGPIPEDDHAFSYIKNLTDIFWNIPDVRYYKADGIDIWGVDVEQKLADVMKQMDEETDE